MNFFHYDTLSLDIEYNPYPLDDSEWLVISDFTATETGSGDGIFNQGETIEINLQVENIGTAISENASVLIRPILSGFYITSIDSMFIAGDISPSSSWSTSEPFTIDLTYVPYDTIAPIEIWIVNNDFSYYNVITQYIPINRDMGIESSPLPEEIKMFAYPNPFNSSLQIDIPADSPFTLEIYDIKGKLVHKDFIPKAQETHSIHWHPKELTSGTYLIKAFNQKNKFQTKVLLLK